MFLYLVESYVTCSEALLRKADAWVQVLGVSEWARQTSTTIWYMSGLLSVRTGHHEQRGDSCSKNGSTCDENCERRRFYEELSDETSGNLPSGGLKEV
jgi:hypothetical protein